MDKGLTQLQKKKLVEIAKKYSLDLLVLFGSRVGKNAKESSDYDFAFLKFSSLSVKDEISLFDDVGDVFEEKAFDLVNLEKNHNVVLRQQIFQHGICLHESSKFLFDKEKEYAYFDYIDSFSLLKPTKEKFLSGAL